MKHLYLAAAAACVFFASAASAQVAIDGTRDAAYGAAKSTVFYLPGTPQNNFNAPTPFTEGVGYSVYLTSDANNVYGFLQTNPAGGGTSAGNFANLYFDIDPQNNNGSDIGFEVTNSRGFVAGGSGYAPVGINYFQGNGLLEFLIPNSAFTAPLAGLASQYELGQQFATIGSTVTLRLSQSFGYSVAGGATYGNDRLGSVTLGGTAMAAAVPEPASWAMMIGGFGLAGGVMRRRRSTGKAALTA